MTDTLTYPIAITPQRLRPGAISCSPEGHVGIVVGITPDGGIYLMDGHPDQSITRIRFSEKLIWLSAARVGGFKAFRPALVNGERASLAPNAFLSGYSAEQYTLSDCYGEIRYRLAARSVDPLAALERSIQDDIYAEVLDRVQAVKLGWAASQTRSIAIPSNIYTAEGDWEAFSTHSRDLRLRRAFLQLPEAIRRYVRLCRNSPEQLSRNTPRDPRRLGQELLKKKCRLFTDLQFQYENSARRNVTLSLADLERRLFRLSFDPNHPPELRWGASGSELDPARQLHARHLRGFEAQQPWRNRLEKKLEPMAVPEADNPSEPPPYDLNTLIKNAIRTKTER